MNKRSRILSIIQENLDEFWSGVKLDWEELENPKIQIPNRYIGHELEIVDYINSWIDYFEGSIFVQTEQASFVE